MTTINKSNTTTDLTATNSQIGAAAQVTSSPNAIVQQINIAASDSPISSAIVAGAVKFTQLAEMMLGPATRELAEMWQDEIRAYRYERQLKCVVKAERMAKDAGFTPQAVPIKLLFPLLEGASMEEDENLHDMWAALLANASSPDGPSKVRPGFIAILRHMAPDEAALLNWIAEGSGENVPAESELMKRFGSCGHGSPWKFDELNPKAEGSIRFKKQFDVCRDGLVAESLLVRYGDAHTCVYALSPRGIEFMKACRPLSNRVSE